MDDNPLPLQGRCPLSTVPPVALSTCELKTFPSALDTSLGGLLCFAGEKQMSPVLGVNLDVPGTRDSSFVAAMLYLRHFSIKSSLPKCRVRRAHLPPGTAAASLGLLYTSSFSRNPKGTWTVSFF